MELEENMQAEKIQNLGLELFNKLLKTFNQKAEDVTALFDDDALIEYPYAAAMGVKPQLNKREYADHLNAILGQMPDIAFSNVRVYPIANSDSFWAEVHGEVVIPKTGKKYEQDYVMYFTVRDSKFSFYREYWNPVAVLQAFDGLENIQETLKNPNK